MIKQTVSVSYNNEYIKVHKNGELVWFKKFYNFETLLQALPEVQYFARRIK